MPSRPPDPSPPHTIVPSSSPRSGPCSKRQSSVPLVHIASAGRFVEYVRQRVPAAPTRPFRVVFPDIPVAWAASVAVEIPEIPERFSFSYDARSRCLVIDTGAVDMSAAHNMGQVLLAIIRVKMCAQGFTAVSEWVAADPENLRAGRLLVQGETLMSGFRGPYLGSMKKPDAMIWNRRWKSNMLPVLVLEAGLSESYEQLLRDKDLWLIGGDGRVRCVLLVKIDVTCRLCRSAGDPPDASVEDAACGAVDQPAVERERADVSAEGGHDTGDLSGSDSVSDSEDDGYFVDSSDASGTPEVTNEDDSPAQGNDKFTGFIELWRFCKERGSPDDPFAAAVCFGRAYMPRWNTPPTQSEYLTLRNSDLYGLKQRYAPAGCNLEAEFKLPAVWAWETISDHWDLYEQLKASEAKVRKRKREADDGVWCAG